MSIHTFHTLMLDGASKTTTVAGTEVDLAYYYATPGKREMKACLVCYVDVATDSGTLAYKIQESATTVDSDFTDISGATFTTVTDASSAAVESIYFFSAKRYIRGYSTVTGSPRVPTVCTLFVQKLEA